MKKKTTNNSKKPKLKKDGTPKKSGGFRPNAGKKKSKIRRHRLGHLYVTETKAKEWGMGDVKRGLRNIRILVQKELDTIEKPF